MNAQPAQNDPPSSSSSLCIECTERRDGGGGVCAF
eukprot:CAMPEP_0113905892 /NCGR_PEP_ID=MMETSP0780_2-20120614/24356_1 /TAXON_ID=652834 /ORGANISM="Palpitomonas bilix" /LENGTH=34 /DNA_ID=CAMNT_0000900255 /DNA_START=92 /DNA_END=193 /DNA_ORIENTATION=- /assembly_acc=CAM_ASM_000599